MSMVWMHPPRDLTPQQVPEVEQTHKQALGWLHADPPAEASASAEETAQENQTSGFVPSDEEPKKEVENAGTPAEIPAAPAKRVKPKRESLRKLPEVASAERVG